jgi:hypothetical protein
MYDHLLTTLSKYNTSISPREIIHVPEWVQRQKEGERGDSKNVDYELPLIGQRCNYTRETTWGLTQHPSNHVPTQSEDKDQSLQTINGSEHDDTERRNGTSVGDDDVKQVSELHRSSVSLRSTWNVEITHIGNGDRRDNSTEQVNEDDSSHSEKSTAST